MEQQHKAALVLKPVNQTMRKLPEQHTLLLCQHQPLRGVSSLFMAIQPVSLLLSAGSDFRQLCGHPGVTLMGFSTVTSPLESQDMLGAHGGLRFPPRDEAA